MTEKQGFDRRLTLAGGAAAALALGYFAFRPSGKPGPRHTQIDPGTFNRGNGAEPQTLDPSLAQGTYEDTIISDLMTGLMTVNAEGRTVPGLATDWQTAPDGLTWTFHLREALWSDGAPVTAADFVFSWRRTLTPATAASYAYFLTPLKNAQAINGGKMPPAMLGATALDARTLEIRLEHPVPYLLEMLSHMSMYPQPAHVVTAKGKDWARPGNHVGNGAYTLTEWVPNDHITLVRNPRFYDAAHVAVQRVVYTPSVDAGAAFRRLRAGELDIQERLPSQQIDWIRANMPELLHPLPQLIVEYTSVNVRRKPFDDVRVRAAINMTINREVITGKISRVGYLPAYGIVPPGTANYPGGVTLDFHALPPAQRLAQAQGLMRAAGFGPDRRLQTSYALRSTTPGASRSAAALLQQLFALIYIDMVIAPFDTAIFYNRVQEHDFDLAQAGWVADFNDAATFLELFETGGGNNYGQYSSPAFDALLARSRLQVDLAARGRILAQAESLLLKDQAVFPIFFGVSDNLVRPYVKGWHANSLDKHYTRWVSIDQAARAALLR